MTSCLCYDIINTLLCFFLHSTGTAIPEAEKRGNRVRTEDVEGEEEEDDY